MKIEINRTALAEALGLLTSVVPSRTPKPILRCIKLNAEEHHLRICATDLEVGINYVLSEIQVHQPGEVLIQADRLAAIVRESKDDVLALEAKDNLCEIKGSDSKFTIYAQDVKQYPTVPVFEEKADLEINLVELQSGIGQSLFATAKESSRYAINGVLWEIKGKKAILVATDGRRLAKCRINLASAPDKSVTENKVIVPAKTMALIEKLGTDNKKKDTVAVKLLDRQILLRADNVVISSNLAEGHFPKYDDIIPSDYDKKLILSTEAVLSAVRRAALLTSEESRGIKLAVSKDSLIFSGRAPETGDAFITMSIDYKGEPVEIGFNPQFLIDALKVIRTPQFEMELGSSDRPGLLKSGSDFIYVLMPINLG